MKKIEKLLLTLSVVFASVFGVTQSAFAMHIMEGYLPKAHCIAWGVVCIPFLVAGFISLRKIVTKERKSLIVLAMAGAYTFVLSALKIPSVSGSSSHPTGTGLGATLFGPSVMSVIGIIVLLFQALLLAHGGLTTLGANTFSMAMVGVFLACTLGDLFTYCVTSFQLALAYPSEVGGVLASAAKFLGIFAVTQVPLAIIEGILSVVVVIGLETYAKPELEAISFTGGEK